LFNAHLNDKTVLLNMILLSHKCFIISNKYYFLSIFIMNFYKFIASAAWQLYSFASVGRMKAGDRTNPQVPVVVWLVMIKKYQQHKSDYYYYVRSSVVPFSH